MLKRIRWVNPIKNFYLENGSACLLSAIIVIIATVALTIFVVATGIWASLPGAAILLFLEGRGVLHYSKVYY